MVAKGKEGIVDTRPLLIVVSSLGATREYFLESVAKRYRVWLFCGGEGRSSEPSWELPHIVGHTSVDTLDASAMVKEARALDAPGPVAGVVSYDETRVIATAKLASGLGLVTSPPEAVARCRDKYLTRTALARFGVPQPKASAVHTEDEALAAAERIGYPVVVKPRNQACGFGVNRVSDVESMAEAFRYADGVSWPEVPREHPDAVLVEECVEGPEISVDSAVFKGNLTPVVVARKRNGYFPSFEEVGHLVDSEDPLLEDPLLAKVLADAHAAVGYDNGVTHTELKITSTGCSIIEINARLGGDLIPYLGHLASGADLSLAAADIACGKKPNLTRPIGRSSGIRFCYPEEDIVLNSVEVIEETLPKECVRADVLASPGQHMKLPPNGSAWQARLAQVVVLTDNAQECEQALDKAAAAVRAEGVRP